MSGARGRGLTKAVAGPTALSSATYSCCLKAFDGARPRRPNFTLGTRILDIVIYVWCEGEWL